MSIIGYSMSSSREAIMEMTVCKVPFHPSNRINLIQIFFEDCCIEHLIDLRISVVC